jgi:hypothetical protein
MDDGERLATDHAQGNQPPLAVVAPLVHPRQHCVLEDQGRIEDVQPALLEEPAPLVLVPFQLQRRAHSSAAARPPRNGLSR